MKKILFIISVLSFAFVLTACGSKGSDSSSELALITDVGTIDDKSFNQGAWEGLKEYAKENGKSYKYYKPLEKTTNAYLSAISLAIEGGAKAIVCPGYLFEEAVYIAQEDYPDVNFIILDGQPHNVDYTDFKINDNVYAVFYAEQEAGFLAGYAAVKEGFTKLGFMGGIKVPAVVRYGYGFVEGAEYAAKEMGITDIEMKYTYTGTFEAKPEVQATAASWYQSGTEVIFGCGGGVGNSVMKAAESYQGKVIGVDVDQSQESETVITSAMKMLNVSVYDAITDFYAGSFPGGQVVIRDISLEGVGLPMENSKFENFSEADYEKVYNQLLNGEIVPSTDTEVEDITKINLEVLKLQVIQ